MCAYEGKERKKEGKKREEENEGTRTRKGRGKRVIQLKGEKVEWNLSCSVRHCIPSL